jgi:hypothetical protein
MLANYKRRESENAVFSFLVFLWWDTEWSLRWGDPGAFERLQPGVVPGGPELRTVAAEAVDEF